MGSPPLSLSPPPRPRQLSPRSSRDLPQGAPPPQISSPPPQILGGFGSSSGGGFSFPLHNPNKSVFFTHFALSRLLLVVFEGFLGCLGDFGGVRDFWGLPEFWGGGLSQSGPHPGIAALRLLHRPFKSPPGFHGNRAAVRRSPAPRDTVALSPRPRCPFRALRPRPALCRRSPRWRCPG